MTIFINFTMTIITFLISFTKTIIITTFINFTMMIELKIIIVVITIPK